MNFDMLTDEQLKVLCKSICTEEDYPIIEAAKIELEYRNNTGFRIESTNVVLNSPKIRIRKLIKERILLIRERYFPNDSSVGGRSKKNKMSIPKNKKEDSI